MLHSYDPMPLRPAYAISPPLQQHSGHLLTANFFEILATILIPLGSIMQKSPVIR